MAIGAVSSVLKGARLGSKKKEDDLQAGYAKYKATPEEEREENPTYELQQEGERLAAIDQAKADKAKNLKDRQSLASNLKDFSGRGALSQEMLGQAREQAKGLGISEDQVSSFLTDNRIKASEFKSVTPQKSPFGSPAKTAEAAAPSEGSAKQEKSGLKGMEGLDARQKLAYAQEFGTPKEQYNALLDARAQDKAEGKPFQSYARMGVGQSKSLTSGTTKQVNALGRLAKKLKRKKLPLTGLNQAVADLAGQASMEPSITSQGYRKTEADRRIALSERGAQRRSMLDDFLKSFRGGGGAVSAKDLQQPKLIEEYDASKKRLPKKGNGRIVKGGRRKVLPDNGLLQKFDVNNDKAAYMKLLNA